MARCLRRKRLYDRYLVGVEETLLRISQKSDWRSRPGAFDDAPRRELLMALEDILDTYVAYGVESDLRRLRSHGIFRTDVKRPPALDDVFAAPPPPAPAKPAKADKKALPANKAYARYFEWFINGEVRQSQQQKTSGVEAFYARYPLLARAVEKAAQHYGTNIELACDRVKKDWQAIEQAFFPKAKLEHLARITSTGNDFHKGGKQVLILTFGLKDGTEGRVVYKPSAVEIDCRIVGDSAAVTAVKPGGYTQDRSLIEIINAYNPAKSHGRYTTKPLPTYVILPYDRDSVENAYGYVQFLTHEPQVTLRPGGDVTRQVADAIAAAQAKRDVVANSDWIVTDPKDAWVYCYQLGVLMAMAVAVSLSDLHVQNAIAHARLPHLIDLEEALKRPMTTITETLLHEVAEESSIGGLELKIVNDDTKGFEVQWMPAPRTPAAGTLYRYDASAEARERVSRVSLVGSDPPHGAGMDSAALRYAVVRGLGDGVGALSSNEGHAKVTDWVAGLKKTLARFVPWATLNYLEKSRMLYWKFCASQVPSAPADYRAFQNESGSRFFVEAAQARRSEWGDRWTKDRATAEWNPRFAVEHPDHAWKDYLEGDVPAFYHTLGSRDLLNSRGEVVDVAAVDEWQRTHLGLDSDSLAQKLAKKLPHEYFPQTPIQMISKQLDDLKTACSSPDGKRDYLGKIMAGITWLDATPLDNLLPRLHVQKKRPPFADADMRSMGDLVSDFLELAPLPEYSGKEEPAVAAAAFPDRGIPLIQPSGKHSGDFAYAKELEKMPFPRVVAYGFRGDSRKPLEFKSQIKNAKDGTVHEWMQGFVPNYTRPRHDAALAEYMADDPNKPRMELIGAGGKPRTAAEVDTSALDLRNYIANEFAGGYISLTRDAMVARSFACGKGGTPRSTPDAWVYCCLAEGAFNVPRKGQHAWATKNEAELAMPGMLEWEDVIGFREVTKDGQFMGPVYLRRSLQRKDRDAFTQLYRVLSGMNQAQTT
jgi:hypothetical protein